MPWIPATPARAAPAVPYPAAALLAVAAALLLSACETGVTLAVTVEGDGSGRVELRLDADAAAVAALDDAVESTAAASEGVDVAHLLDAFAATVERLEGWTLDDVTHDDGARTVAGATRVDDPAELEAVTADLAAAMDVDEGRLFGPLRVDVDDDTVRLDGDLAALVDPAAALGLTEAPEEVRVGSDGGTTDLAGLVADAPFTVRLEAEMPGPARETNADTVDDRRLVWHGQAGEVRTVAAVAERSSLTWWRWPAVGGATALVAATGVLLLARRRR